MARETAIRELHDARSAPLTFAAMSETKHASCVDCGASFIPQQPADEVCDRCWHLFELDLAVSMRGAVR